MKVPISWLKDYVEIDISIEELAERLTAIQHDHHDLTVAAMHVHLDHENCLESVVLRGETAAVRSFAESLMAERGVRHGALNVVALEPEHADGLYRCIRELIDNKYGGHIEKAYLFQLILARRR